MKKLIALMLAVLAVVSLFAGCGPTATGPVGPGWTGSDDAPYEVDENGNFIYGDTFKDVTVEWWISSHYDLNSDMYIFKKLEEVVGCQINLTRYDSETYQAKINTALNTNSLPDICSLGVDASVYNVYGEQGAFVNLLSDAALARMPSLKKNVLDIPEAAQLLESQKSSSGALYGLPRYNTERVVNHGWMYRKDIFEKHGIEMWHDTESFLDVLRQLKKLYPDSYPLTGASMSAIFDRMMSCYGVNDSVLAYDWDKKEWFLGASTEAYYEMMCIFQKAWDEDLVDPDIFTNEVNDIDVAILNGTSFVFNSWIGRMAEQNPAGKDKDPNFQVSYAPHIGDGKGNQLPLVASTNVVINAQSPNVDACLAIWNYLYSEEGTYACTVGEEGVTYDLDADGNKVYKNADGTEMLYPTIQSLEEQYGLWNAHLYPLASRESVYFTYSPEEAEAQEIGAKGGLLMGVPLIAVPEEYGEEYYDMAHNLTMDIQQFSAKFVTEGYTKEQWESSVQTWMTKYGKTFDILNGKV